MKKQDEQIIEKALSLPPLDRTVLAEKLLTSLDEPDAILDELWAKEAENRINAFEAGELESVPVKDVFKKYESR